MKLVRKKIETKKKTNCYKINVSLVNILATRRRNSVYFSATNANWNQKNQKSAKNIIDMPKVTIFLVAILKSSHTPSA